MREDRKRWKEEKKIRNKGKGERRNYEKEKWGKEKIHTRKIESKRTCEIWQLREDWKKRKERRKVETREKERGEITEKRNGERGKYIMEKLRERKDAKCSN